MSDFDFSAAAAAHPAAASPIADLSYRGYDGPLHTRAARWSIVTASVLRAQVRKPGLWVLGLVAFLPYTLIVIVVYTGLLQQQPVSGDQNPYAQMFFTAMQQQQFWILLAALLVGSGSIAADNRANALLVYLAKPITKGDYLLGKWMGSFSILAVISLAPGLVALTYCTLSLWGSGFAHKNQGLYWQVPLAALVGPAVHASLICGFSAWSKAARTAGSLYFGFYILTAIVSGIIGQIEFKGHFAERHQVQTYSVSGSIEGLIQNIFHLTITSVRMGRGSQFRLPQPLPPPGLPVTLFIVVGLIVLGTAAARARINAVEVIRG